MTDPIELSDEQTLILQKLDDLITIEKKITARPIDDDDLQDDHIEALRLVMEGMMRRNLSSSEVRKNISVFFYRVECFYRHYCYNTRELSLDDLEIFKSIQF